MDAALLARTCALSASVAALWAPHLTEAMGRFGIDTPARRAMFLAQCAHESGNFDHLEENLNYSAQALARTWPNRYSSNGRADGMPNELATRIARKPQDIANATYANRMGNGTPATGDGWAYRGRGPIMITGRDLYARAGAATGIDLVRYPELALTLDVGSLIAAWIWSDKRCNPYADRGDIEGCTRVINGGVIGLADRARRWGVAKRAMGVT